jgi:hypothetical protein
MLQLFKIIIESKIIYRIIKMPSLKSWVQTPSGLIIRGGEAQALECKVENC